MDITVTELKKKMDGDEDVVLIDVREPHEVNQFNIGGINIPLNKLFNSLDDLLKYKNKEIVIYCRSGSRSEMAKRILIQSGFSNVRNLIGGMNDWQYRIK
jgi:rhodanese-related sulfurtransferase